MHKKERKTRERLWREYNSTQR